MSKKDEQPWLWAGSPEGIPADDGPSARARQTDPETSHEAAAGINVNAIHRKVLSALAGSNDMTTQELSVATGIERLTISPRMVELEAKGMVTRMEPRLSLNAQGRQTKMIAWAITEVGKHLCGSAGVQPR